MEFHSGEWFRRVGFIVIKLNLLSRGLVRFYERSTTEQLIKEGKRAVMMTRLSCHRFRSNEVRLWLSAVEFNLGNRWRRLVLPNRIGNWSLTSLQQRLVKMGAIHDGQGWSAGTRRPGGIGSLPAGGTGEVARPAFARGNHMADHHGSRGAATPPGELTHGLHRWIHGPGLAPLPVAATFSSSAPLSVTLTGSGFIGVRRTRRNIRVSLGK